MGFYDRIRHRHESIAGRNDVLTPVPFLAGATIALVERQSA